MDRELMKSRHYVLEFLARRGVVYREGQPWSQANLEWLRRLGANVLLISTVGNLLA
jgi:hypothetical protein